MQTASFMLLHHSVIEASVKQVTKKQAAEGEYAPICWKHVIKCKADYPVNSYISEGLIRAWSMWLLAFVHCQNKAFSLTFSDVWCQTGWQPFNLPLNIVASKLASFSKKLLIGIVIAMLWLLSLSNVRNVCVYVCVNIPKNENILILKLNVMQVLLMWKFINTFWQPCIIFCLG